MPHSRLRRVGSFLSLSYLHVTSVVVTSVYISTAVFIKPNNQESSLENNLVRRPTVFTALLFFTLVSISEAQTQTIPSVRAKALDDSEVTLPKPADQQILILVLGFSKKSADDCQLWARHIGAEMLEDPRVNYYQIPNLEGTSSLAKKLILHGMRSGLSTEQLSHLVPLYDSQDEWKKLVNFSAPDDAYLIVATPDGQITWQSHGPFSASNYTELKKAASTLLKKM